MVVCSLCGVQVATRATHLWLWLNPNPNPSPNLNPSPSPSPSPSPNQVAQDLMLSQYSCLVLDEALEP